MFGLVGVWAALAQLRAPHSPSSITLKSTSLHKIVQVITSLIMPQRQIRSRLKQTGKEWGKGLKNIAWQSCKCALYTICSPCLCCAMLFFPRRRRCGHMNTCPMNFPMPELPGPRRRAMSLPLIEAQPDQKTLHQLQSSFMTKLPLEIRRMIYMEALGGKKIHIMTYQGKPKAKQCWKEGTCTCEFFDPAKEKDLSVGLGLLRTCRVVYSEAIEYLYSGNSFSLSSERDEYPTVHFLSYYFLPQRLAQIRDLHIHWQLDGLAYLPMYNLEPRRAEYWFSPWSSLIRLTGLRRLRIYLDYSQVFWYGVVDHEFWNKTAVQLLRGAKEITAPSTFVVSIPSSQCALGVDVGNSQCIFEVRSGGTEVVVEVP
ncbi:hypothetical protein BDU57DRAFT_198807 [Ampelomyces quisqualis]|uniref:DUF7730 domain-containing protein n=1 Tax=Ampelomyces quisqualis TaxID=50730 RepID=A0A6A5QSK3_AMPQU|nr:hypothetical protein BDU57DRAFT_198807 [Ampelomyces quisqualis]